MKTESYHRTYDSLRMARSYAFDRPPVHARIIERIRGSLQIQGRARRALDIGCGAGLSTAVLSAAAERVFGLEPVPAMLAHCHAVAPEAMFVAGQAERLPFRSGSFDLVTAAGSLNYVDLELFLPELVRVLTPGGVMVIYDFSEGRRIPGDDRLDVWWRAFAERFPPRPGYEMDVRAIDYARHGLRLDTHEAFDVGMPMTLDEYVRYVLSESGVEIAIERGLPEAQVRGWCEVTLADILDQAPRDVLFEAYFASVTYAGSS